MSYKPIAPAPTGSNHTPPGSCGSSPSLPSSSNFRPAFSDFGPPSMGFVQPVKVSQGSTYSELLSVIEEMSREIRPTYAGSKSAMERLKRGTQINPCDCRTFETTSDTCSPPPGLKVQVDVVQGCQFLPSPLRFTEESKSGRFGRKIDGFERT
ncbi:cyclin-dependent kinase 2-associated protein 2-like isoform X1 [Xyrauchen texanus]|uniref:cyclin-dependent kinase 2-associated protein 2-like isoform X1 n=1 Tax=Xyrauchen texanus TaxID=154827 RepID=UPI002241CDEB|nr:cyclin-dependent kinase 2-associated protein 2-like isoform X1 [Xyrauchen texanus]